MNTSILFNDITKKYNHTNLILTNSENFKKDFIHWFDNRNNNYNNYNNYNSENKTNIKLKKKIILSTD